ncbi:MAG TPA: glycine zipper 2TM domain-containing protein [Steroidobacteraceae bacterium]|nr:glycine zipper 2TM domain-containing protein [Steroidobacteraceae bacterium]
MSRSIRVLTAAAAALSLTACAALADPSSGYYGPSDGGDGDYDYADVVHVEPLRRQVRVSEPVRECWQETVQPSTGPFSYNHVGGTLIGSAIGIAAGNQVGHGRGKDVARVAGALIGGAIGHNVSVDRQRQLHGDRGRVVERCDVRYRDSTVERIDGYEVTYEYAGREYVTRLPYDPGQRLRVRVDVGPA